MNEKQKIKTRSVTKVLATSDSSLDSKAAAKIPKSNNGKNSSKKTAKNAECKNISPNNDSKSTTTKKSNSTVQSSSNDNDHTIVTCFSNSLDSNSVNLNGDKFENIISSNIINTSTGTELLSTNSEQTIYNSSSTQFSPISTVTPIFSPAQNDDFHISAQSSFEDILNHISAADDDERLLWHELLSEELKNRTICESTTNLTNVNISFSDIIHQIDSNKDAVKNASKPIYLNDDQLINIEDCNSEVINNISIIPDSTAGEKTTTCEKIISSSSELYSFQETESKTNNTTTLLQVSGKHIDLADDNSNNSAPLNVVSSNDLLTHKTKSDEYFTTYYFSKQEQQCFQQKPQKKKKIYVIKGTTIAPMPWTGKRVIIFGLNTNHKTRYKDKKKIKQILVKIFSKYGKIVLQPVIKQTHSDIYAILQFQSQEECSMAIAKRNEHKFIIRAAELKVQQIKSKQNPPTINQTQLMKTQPNTILHTKNININNKISVPPLPNTKHTPNSKFPLNKHRSCLQQMISVQMNLLQQLLKFI